MAEVSANSNDTKRRIFRAAAKLFAMKGYDATSMRALAKEADVNLALINYHFKDKAHLLNSVIEYGLVRWTEMLEGQKDKSLKEMLIFLMKQASDMDGAAYYLNIFMRLYLDSSIDTNIKKEIIRSGPPKIEILQWAVAKEMGLTEINSEATLISHYLINNLIMSSRISFGLGEVEIKKAYIKDCFNEDCDPYLEQLIQLADRLTKKA